MIRWEGKCLLQDRGQHGNMILVAHAASDLREKFFTGMLHEKKLYCMVFGDGKASKRALLLQTTHVDDALLYLNAPSLR